MLSTPLFRDGDKVHRRNDLCIMALYSMLHNNSMLELTDTRLHAMTNVCEPCVVNHGTYCGVYYHVHSWFVCDEMFVEGNRIMRYIVP